MRNNLRNLDIFGCPINLTMRKDYSYKSSFGGIMTLLLMVSMAALIVYSFSRLFLKKDLYVNKYQVNLKSEYGYLDLNYDNFMIAMKFDDETLNNWTSPFMNLSLVHVVQYRNETSLWRNKTYINLRPCQKNDFKGLETDYEQLSLSTALCPDSNFNTSIQGSYQENVFAYFQVALTTCSDPLVCQDQDVINSVISGIDKIRVQFRILSNIVEENNYENPLSTVVNAELAYIIDPLKDIYRATDIYLDEIEINDDVGFLPTLLPNIYSRKSFTYNQLFREETVFTVFNPKIKIADFYFRKSEKKYQYDRVTGNLLDTFSYLGGIWSSLLLFFNFFLSIYNRNFFINCLSNEIYAYPSRVAKNNKIKKKKLQQQNINENDDDDEDGNDNSNSPSQNFYEKITASIDDYFNLKNQFKLGFFGMWKLIIKDTFSFICSKDEKSILWKQTEDKLLEDLDICNILKKLREIDKMKSILFTKEQLIMLGFIPKPEIFPEDKRIFERSGKPPIINAFKVISAAEDSIPPINRNLINMFGDDLSKVFDSKKQKNKKVMRFINVMKSQNNSPLKNNIKSKKSDQDDSIEIKQNKANINMPINKTKKQNGHKEKKKNILKNGSLEKIYQEASNNVENFDLNEKKIIILDKNHTINNQKAENDVTFHDFPKIDQKLYENLIEMNKNISKICDFNVLQNNV